MIDPNMIPPEVVEAVAYLLCRERHPCWSIVQEVMEMDIDGQGTEFRHIARAAIAAGLAAWPGAWDDIVEGQKGRFLILPLPTEVSDD